MGVWHFNPDYVLGIYFFNLPLEEVLFFLCIPYACVFTYHCLSIYPKIKLSASLENGITVLIILFLVLTAIFNLSRIYTSVTFISLSVLLITTKYFLQREWLGKFYIVYLVLLLPFLIVNGLLTGTGLPEPVVIYNNLENLGLRIFTIPFEDVFYGMCLILLNVLLYEWFETQPATK